VGGTDRLTFMSDTDTPTDRRPPADLAVARALRRGLVMALSRDRKYHFLASPVRTTVGGILTLGLLPGWNTIDRIDRFSRLEWVHLQHFSKYLHMCDADAAPALRLADDLSRQKPPVWTMRLLLLMPTTLVIAMTCLPHLTGTAAPTWIESLARISPLASLWSGFSMSGLTPAVLAVPWIVMAIVLIRHALQTASWSAVCSHHLIRIEKRPLASTPPPWSWRWLWLGMATATIGLWMLPTLIVCGMMNQYFLQTRERRMRLIERALELDPDQPLPVEYDVHQADADELAVLLGS
jgi:hypothetical protein